jgi:hypothetical protein
METTHPSIPAELVQLVSRDHLMETNRQIAQWVRISGSREERQAFEYVQAQLQAFGLRTTWLEHPALISYPLESSLQVIDDVKQVVVNIPCLGHAFSASIENLEAEIVDLEFGNPADYEKKDVHGKIVLLNGLATPTAVYQAEQAGAIGQVFINDDHLHNMIVSTIWGTPTPESAKRFPKTPAVSVVQVDGLELRRRIASGRTCLRISTRIYRDWQTTPIVVGDLDGQTSDDFVMLSGHLDSWDYGAMDNGSANATMLEVARVLAQDKSQLARGLRVLFWSGHSHGRYSGSTWYADHHWEELYDHCVAHVNVDSTGARGATFYGTFLTHMELAALGADIIHEHTGQTARPFRMSRAGDMSFNGIGIPALFMELSQVPVRDDDSNYVTRASASLFGGAMPWWWHTSEDTLDKIDTAVLELDTRMYLDTVWRLCASPVLPMHFGPAIQEIRRELDGLQEAAGEHVDLGLARRRAIQLAQAVELLAPMGEMTLAAGEAAKLNRVFKTLSRLLIPITYTSSGPFAHDPAWGVPFLPSLQPARRLPGMDPGCDEYRFLKTELERSLNAVAFALRQAVETVSA